MASTIPGDDTMPIFTASGRISSNTASIWSRTISGDISWTDRTPIVFCAVMAVITEVANSLCAWMVLISACMPAPPLESEPAMVSTVRMLSMVHPLLVRQPQRPARGALSSRTTSSESANVAA